MENATFRFPPGADINLESLLSSALESVADGCALLDDDFRFVYCSEAFAANLGPLADLLVPGTSMADALRGSIERGVVDAPSGPLDAHMAARMEALRNCEIATIRLKESGRILEVRPYPVDGGGRLLVRTDITDLVQAQREAEKQSILLKDAIESINGGVALYDADERFVWCNDLIRDEFRAVDHILQPGVNFTDIARAVYQAGYVHGAEDEDTFVATRLADFRALRHSVIDLTDAHKAYDHRHYRTNDGGTLIIRTDISELRQAQQSALRLGRHLEDALESIDGGAVLYDADEVLIYCNTWMRNAFPSVAGAFTPGRSFEDVARSAYQAGFVRGYASEDDYIVERLRRFRRLESAVIRHGEGDIWHLHRQYRTSDGGTLIIRTDISDLRRAQYEAEQANRAKSEFLSSMSHEVRTPLNAVLGFAQLLQLPQGDPLTPRQQDCTDHIIESGEHLLALLDQVLELSRIEAGSIDISPGDVDVVAVTAAVIEATRAEAMGQAVTLSLETAAE